MKKSIFLLGLLFMFSCGPVVISSRPNHPPPNWFYPDRLEIVRYVYFPEFSVYYDLSEQTYLYLDGSDWVRRREPPSYRNIDLTKQRYERIKNYQEENIRKITKSTTSTVVEAIKIPPNQVIEPS